MVHAPTNNAARSVSVGFCFFNEWHFYWSKIFNGNASPQAAQENRNRVLCTHRGPPGHQGAYQLQIPCRQRPADRSYLLSHLNFCLLLIDSRGTSHISYTLVLSLVDACKTHRELRRVFFLTSFTHGCYLQETHKCLGLWLLVLDDRNTKHIRLAEDSKQVTIAAC